MPDSPFHDLTFARQYDAAVRGDYPVHARAARAIAEFAAPQSDHTVLDLGAGTGLVSTEILRRTPRRLILSDQSAAMLEIASEQLAPIAANTTVTYVVCDADQLAERLPTESVDTAIASYVFGWLPDPHRALAAVAATLRPGGTLTLDAMPDNEPPPRFMATAPVFQAFSRIYRNVVINRLPTPRRPRVSRSRLDFAAYTEMAQAVGLEVADTLRQDFAFTPDEIEAIWRHTWLFSLASQPGLHAATPGTLAALTEEAIERTRKTSEYRTWRATGEPLVETYSAIKLWKPG